jgi:GT2 family glycosyltransferase
VNQIEDSQKSDLDLDRKARRVLSDLTVIIPSVGRPLLLRCLQAISSGNRLPGQIIVIDQGDNPEVADWIRNIKDMGIDIFHLLSKERSPASARNRGIEQVQTPFVAAIDDDCLPDWDWLEKMEMQLRENPEVIVTGHVAPAGDGSPPTIATSEVKSLIHRPSLRYHSPLTSGNMGFALNTAQRIGPFDENLFTAEDNDWAYRALRAGIPILYAPGIIVHHYHWRDQDQMAKTHREYALGQGAFYGKHLRRGDLSMLVRIAISLFRNFRLFIRGILESDVDKRMNASVGISRLLKGLVTGFRGLKTLGEQ